MSSEFQGKTAVITGASRGIGAASAIALAKAGVPRLILHYNSYREGAEEVLTELRAAGADGELVGADLSNQEGIDQLYKALEALGDVDILVNNAGSLVKRATLLQYTPELFDVVMNLNVKSAYFAAKAVAPGMIRKGSGHIINLSSIAGRIGGGPGATIYAAAKAAITAMTKGLAKELAPSGIHVNAISPGTVDNDFHKQFSTREVLDRVIAMTPAGRLATNEEMADVIVFLCSNAARYVYGQTLELNGGMLMV